MAEKTEEQKKNEIFKFDFDKNDVVYYDHTKKEKIQPSTWTVTGYYRENEKVTDPAQWQSFPLIFGTDYKIYYKKYSSSATYEFQPLEDGIELDFEMGQCYTLEYRLDAKFTNIEGVKDENGSLISPNPNLIKTQTIIISHEDPTKMYIPPSSTEYKRDKYRVTGSDLQRIRDDLTNINRNLTIVIDGLKPESSSTESSASRGLFATIGKQKPDAVLNAMGTPPSRRQGGASRSTSQVADLYEIDKPTGDLLDQICTKMGQIQKSFNDGHLGYDYTVELWRTFVGKYIESKANENSTIYYGKQIAQDRSEMMKIFFHKCKDKISNEQIKELYTLMAYDDNFVKRVILDTNDENGDLTMKGDLLSLGKNYMVDGTEQVYLDNAGFPVLDNGTKLEWYNIGKDVKDAATGNLGFRRLTNAEAAEKNYKLRSMHRFYSNYVTKTDWGWDAHKMGEYGKGDILIDKNKGFGGKRVTRRKRKQKRRSTRKRR